MTHSPCLSEFAFSYIPRPSTHIKHLVKKMLTDMPTGQHYRANSPVEVSSPRLFGFVSEFDQHFPSMNEESLPLQGKYLLTHKYYSEFASWSLYISLRRLVMIANVTLGICSETCQHLEILLALLNQYFQMSSAWLYKKKYKTKPKFIQSAR